MIGLALAVALTIYPPSVRFERSRETGSGDTLLDFARSERGGEAFAAHPEAKPFPSSGRAKSDVNAALKRAQANSHRVLVIFGGNWCHDSRALAGWFATPRFSAMLAQRYEIVWVNVGKKTRNLDLARSYGLDGILGTPTVLMLDAGGKPLNLIDAPTWRNAASRSEDAIYGYFAKDQ